MGVLLSPEIHTFRIHSTEIKTCLAACEVSDKALKSLSAEAAVPLDHKRCSQAVMTIETFMISSVACSSTEKRYHHYLDTRAPLTLLKQFAAC